MDAFVQRFPLPVFSPGIERLSKDILWLKDMSELVDRLERDIEGLALSRSVLHRNRRAIYIQFEKMVPKVLTDWIKDGRVNPLDYPPDDPLSPMKFRKTIWWSWCGDKLQQHQGDRYCCLICHHKTAMQYDSVMMTDRNYVHLFEKGKISICDGCYQYAHAVYGAISYKVNRHGPTGLFILHREEGAW